MYTPIHALTYFLQIKLLLYTPSEPALRVDGDPPPLKSFQNNLKATSFCQTSVGAFFVGFT